MSLDSPATTRMNPDSYVYFAMAMYYLEQYGFDLSSLTVQEEWGIKQYRIKTTSLYLSFAVSHAHT